MKIISLSDKVLLAEVSKMLAEGFEVTLKTKGNSMLPFIVGGRDSVVLRKSESLHHGDIVLAQVSSHKFVLHRIIKIKEKNVTLMGDGNIHGTEQCDIADIAGYVVRIVRKGKYINSSSKTERLKVKSWHLALPLRKYLLAIYKRTIYKHENQRGI